MINLIQPANPNQQGGQSESALVAMALLFTCGFGMLILNPILLPFLRWVTRLLCAIILYLAGPDAAPEQEETAA